MPTVSQSVFNLWHLEHHLITKLTHILQAPTVVNINFYEIFQCNRQRNREATFGGYLFTQFFFWNNRWKKCGLTGNQTQGLSLTVLALYHWATEPPVHLENFSTPITWIQSERFSLHLNSFRYKLLNIVLLLSWSYIV